MKILFIDTETGGIDPTNHSLLSMAFVVWEESKIIDSSEILVNDGELKVTKEALEINGIDLEEHKTKALTPELAIQKMDDFFNIHFSPNEKITLAGHNINFDVNFIMFFLKKYNYKHNDRFSYRYVDTATVLMYLYLTGWIEKKVFSLEEALELFEIKAGKLHTALGDAYATAELFSKLVSINKK